MSQLTNFPTPCDHLHAFPNSHPIHPPPHCNMLLQGNCRYSVLSTRSGYVPPCTDLQFSSAGAAPLGWATEPAVVKRQPPKSMGHSSVHSIRCPHPPASTCCTCLRPRDATHYPSRHQLTCLSLPLSLIHCHLQSWPTLETSPPTSRSLSTWSASCSTRSSSSSSGATASSRVDSTYVYIITPQLDPNPPR